MGKISLNNGINKKLKERRLELHLSTLEAAIKLDISKTTLRLIENGYIKAIDPQLQELIIYKYKLDKDFFSDENANGWYPSVETPDVPPFSEKATKAISSLGWKITTGALAVILLAMAAVGFAAAPTVGEVVPTFYTEKFNNARDYAVKNGTKHDYTDGYVSSYIADDFYSIDLGGIEESEIGYYYTGLNFFSLTENMNLTFLNGWSLVNTAEIPEFKEMGIDLGIYFCDIETRVKGNNARTHFYCYEDGGLFDEYSYHINCDVDLVSGKFSFNSITENSVLIGEEKLEKDSFEFFIYSTLFKFDFLRFNSAMVDFFTYYQPILNYTYEGFLTDLRDGNLDLTNYQYVSSNFATWGTVFGIIA